MHASAARVLLHNGTAGLHTTNHMQWYLTMSPERVCFSLLQIMASMIEEADDVSQPLLDNILECVMSPKKEEQPESYA